MQLQVVFHLRCIEQEVLVSALLIGALIASLVGGIFIDRQGRRKAILVSNAILLCGSLILTLARSLIWLVGGRLTVGFAISLSSMACCIYVSEMVAAHQRGLLVSLYEAGITMGILLSYALNYIFTDTPEGWRYMFGLAIALAVIQFVSILFLPNNSRTFKVHYSVTHSNLIQPSKNEDGEDIILPCPMEKNYSLVDLFRSKDNMRNRTFIGLGLVLFQQFTGQPNALYYASTIFRSVGFQTDSSAILASVGLGVMKVIATLFAMFFADKVGRRVLLMAGCLVMAFSVMIIGLVSCSVPLDMVKDCETLIDSNNTSFGSPHLHINSVSPQPAASYFLLTKDTSEIQVESTFAVVRPAVKMLTNNKSRGERATITLENEQTQFLTQSVEEKERDTNSSISGASSKGHMLLNWITLLSLMAFVSAFSIGFGPSKYLPGFVFLILGPSYINGPVYAWMYFESY